MNKIQSIQQKFTQPSKVQAVEVFFNEDSFVSFSLCVYEKKKNAVSLKEEKTNIKSIEELCQNLKDKNAPVILCVDGKGILIKKIAGADETPDTLAGRVIPNANADDFFIEQVVNGNYSFVSLIRKQALEDLVKEIVSKGFFIVKLHIGPAVTSCLSGILVNDNVIKNIEWRNYSISVSAEGLHDINRRTEQTQTELPFASEKFLAFASACAYFTGWDGANSKIHAEKIQQSSVEFTDKKKFSFYAASLVVFFLIALMTNFFIFQHYWKKQQELESQVGWQESAVKNYEDMKKNISDKMSFALETGLLSEEKIAWFADQLGSTVPEGVKLSRLSVYPKEKKIVDGEESYFFNQHSIQLTGYSENEGVINDWIKLMKEKEFAGKVVLASFMQDEEKQTGKFAIEIEIK